MSDDDEAAGLTRDWDTIYATVQISAIIGAVVYLLFELWRPYRDGKTPAYGGNIIAQQRAGKGPDGGLPSRPNAPFGWLKPLLEIDAEGALLRLVGLDAYVVIRYLRLQARLSGTAALFNLLLLMPTYETGGEDLPSDFSRVTMSNLSDGSSRFWLPALLGIIYGSHALWLIGREYEGFLQNRMEFMANGSEETSPQARYTIIVENLPAHLRTPSLARGYFEYLFPGKIHSTVLCVNGKSIAALLKLREDIARRLETAYVTEERKPEKAPLLITPPYPDMDATMETLVGGEPPLNKAQRFFKCCCLCGCCGCNCTGPGKVELIPYYEEILQRINTMVAEQQAELRGNIDRVDAIGTENLPSSEKVALYADTEPPMEDEKVDDAPKKAGLFGMIAQTFQRKDDMLPLREPLGASDFYSGEDTRLTKAAAARQTGTCERISSTVFVTFTSLAAKQSAIQVLISNRSAVTASDAAEPRDVIWHDIHQSKAASEKNRLIAKIFFAVLFAFFSIPVAACASASLDTLEDIIPPLSMFRGNYGYTTLGTFLPTIASLALLAIVPMIFAWSAENFEYFKSRQEVQTKIFERNYMLVMVYTYITLTAGSVFDALADIIADPFSILSLLGNTIPGTAGYFINVIVIKTFQGAIMELGRPVPHILFWFFSRKGDDDLGPRDLIKRDAPNAVSYGMLVPGFMLVALVAYLLELICPAVQCFAFLYFFITYLVWKHQFIYVYHRPSESGGKIIFFRLYQRTFTGILMGQITLVAYLLIRQAFWPAIVSIIMPVITLVVSTMFKNRYEPQAANLSYEKALYVDERTEGIVDDFEEDTYLQPALKETESVEAAHPHDLPVAGDKKAGKPEPDVEDPEVMAEPVQPYETPEAEEIEELEAPKAPSDSAEDLEAPADRTEAKTPEEPEESEEPEDEFQQSDDLHQPKATQRRMRQSVEHAEME